MAKRPRSSNTIQPPSIPGDFWLVAIAAITAVGLVGPYYFLDIRFAISLTILVLAWWVDVILKKMFFGKLEYTFLADLSLAGFSFALSYALALASLEPLVAALKNITDSDVSELETLLSSNIFSLTYAAGVTAIVGFLWLLNLVLSKTLASPQLRAPSRVKTIVWLLAISLTIGALLLALHPQLAALS